MEPVYNIAAMPQDILGGFFSDLSPKDKMAFKNTCKSVQAYANERLHLCVKEEIEKIHQNYREKANARVLFLGNQLDNLTATEVVHFLNESTQYEEFMKETNDYIKICSEHIQVLKSLGINDEDVEKIDKQGKEIKRYYTPPIAGLLGSGIKGAAFDKLYQSVKLVELNK